MATVTGNSADPGVPGVLGESTNDSNAAGPGVHGKSAAAGVVGDSTTWHGVAGISQSTIGGAGVYGKNTAGGTGVVGESDGWMGVYGKSASTTGGAGVMGEAFGSGVIGVSQTWIGVYGETAGVENGPAGVWGEHKGAGTGVKAVSKDGVGLAAFSTSNEAIHAETKSTATAAMSAYQLNPDSDSAAFYAKHAGNRTAAVFEGNVIVTGDITMANADCAEDFDISAESAVEPGMVMVLDDEGKLRESGHPYDKRVAGVISGAGNYKPSLVLDKQQAQQNRKPVALLGKVFCKVDAGYAPIAVGDLLTTSDTPGHAMKAADPLKAFGAVIGKALRPLQAGQGLIPILIALQ